MDTHKQAPWHAQTIADVYAQLHTSADGLSDVEASGRLQEHGYNELRAKASKTVWQMLKAQILDPMVLILIAAAVFSAVLREWTEAAVIFAIVVVNAVIGIVQEKKAQASLEALRSMSAPTACVLRQSEESVIPTCEELGIGFVAFSPLASGFLSGKYNESTQYAGDDVRRVITRFDRDNVRANQPLLDLLGHFAQSKNVTLAQISLAWMLKKKDFIVPIPGMRRDERIIENLAAADVELTDTEFAAIEAELAKIKIYGNRTDADIAKLRDMQ